MVMAANLGGLSGAQVLRTEDAPLYINGFKNMACIIAGSWVVSVILAVVYIFDERRDRKKSEENTVEEHDMSATL